MTREQMIAAAEKFEVDLRFAVSASQPDLSDKDYCHLLAMKCVQYEMELAAKNERIPLALKCKRLSVPLRLVRGTRGL